MPGIGIIANPNAKLNKRNPKRQKILYSLAKEAGRLKITNNIEELHQAAHDFYKESIEILAIIGGDGTISRTISTFIDNYQNKPLPFVAILRGGTANNIADNLGIKSSPEKNLQKLIQLHKSSKVITTTQLPSLVIDNRYGFLFADGVCAYFLKEFYKEKKGIPGAIFLVVRLFISQIFSTPLFKETIKQEHTQLIYSNKKRIDHYSCSTLCSTLKKIPLGIPYFFKTNACEFECISVTTKPRDLSWKYVPKALLMPKLNQKEQVSFCTQDLTVIKDHPFLYTLDGELYRTNKNQINQEFRT